MAHPRINPDPPMRKSKVGRKISHECTGRKSCPACKKNLITRRWYWANKRKTESRSDEEMDRRAAEWLSDTTAGTTGRSGTSGAGGTRR